MASMVKVGVEVRESFVENFEDFAKVLNERHGLNRSDAMEYLLSPDSVRRAIYVAGQRNIKKLSEDWEVVVWEDKGFGMVYVSQFADYADRYNKAHAFRSFNDAEKFLASEGIRRYLYDYHDGSGDAEVREVSVA